MSAERPSPVLLDDPQLWEIAHCILDEGGCIVVPTDTVYGLAARADRPEAVSRLQKIKGRTDAFPPPVLIADTELVWPLVDPVPIEVQRLAHRFWPGPLTLILPTDHTDLSLAAATGTVGVRVPALDELRAFLRLSGPLAVSSANKHNLAPATTIDEAIDQLGAEVGLYIDGGPTPGLAPSTVVNCVGPITVVRVGLLSREQISLGMGATDA